MMERYSEYKDSGVQWLGKIPSHWEVKRLASCFTERKVKVSDKEFDPLSVTKNGIYPQLENVAKTNDGDNRKLVLSGDFVINSRSDRKGSSGVAKQDGSVSLINIVLKPRKNIYPDFCNYLLKCYSFIEEYYRNGRGIVADLWTTRYDEMKTIKISVPLLNEQKAIVRYLNKVTSKIDEAIAQQQKMIDLLNERKQIIINNAVTKGLNPDVPMKNSGVEWIGKIPKHWDVIRMKFTGSFENGLTYSPSDISDKHGTLVLRSSNIQSCKLDFRDCVYVYHAPKELIVRKGDIIICSRNGSANLIGKCAYVDKDINATFGAFMMRYRPHIFDKFAFYLFQLAISFYRGLFSTTTINQLTKGVISQIKVPFVPYIEQIAIADYLDAVIAKIDVAIIQQQKMIDFLNERKQIIINDVVTGKVKVS